MGIFICEKCGKLDNTACDNNYCIAKMNKYMGKIGEDSRIHFEPEFSYFENHICCSDCCNGVRYENGTIAFSNSGVNIKDKVHWTKYGKEQLLEWEKRNDGSMVNATEYFKSIGEL